MFDTAVFAVRGDPVDSRAMRRVLALCSASLVAFVTACSSPDGGSRATPLPPLGTVKLTTETRLEPVRGVDGAASRSPGVPANLTAMVAEGYGETRAIGGEAITGRTLDGAAAPAFPQGSVRLARFVHLADTQLADDESPARVARLDNPGAAGGAYRPQEYLGCVMLRAAVRTINAIHRADPLDAVVLGGDNADNAQTNEVEWFLGLLRGGTEVHCDSGSDDDLVPGPDNDGKDPLVSEGLTAPWLWVTGNHDILNQGTIRTTVNAEEPIGTVASLGTRDWTVAGGPIRSGDFVVADPQRAYLTRTELMARVLADGNGHGLKAANGASGRADYTFDLGTKLRVIALDTAAETGSSEGVLRAGVIDGFLKPALDAAKRDGKYVILTSHHASTSLTDGSDAGGTRQPDAISTSDFRALLASYPNVIMHLAAHSHEHKAEAVSGANPYWEVKSASLMDYPHQPKIYELWQTPTGDVVVRTVAFDFSTEGDPLASLARTIGVVDYTCGYTPDGRGRATDRNLDLWVSKR
jgi:3',5'-cyclic AMP phosphodiesterase CpdA